MGFSIPMVFSSKKLYKVCTILGIVLYVVLNLHHKVIIPNYYSLRDWLCIIGGLLFLMAVDTDFEQENPEKQEDSEKSEEIASEKQKPDP